MTQRDTDKPGAGNRYHIGNIPLDRDEWHAIRCYCFDNGLKMGQFTAMLFREWLVKHEA